MTLSQTVSRFASRPTPVLACRLILGALFILTGGLKALTAPGELEALFRAYQVIPENLLRPLALALPWLELITGAFCLAGYLTRWAAAFIGLQLLAFISVLSIVLALGIDLADCGCFGGLGIREGPRTALVRDLLLLAMAAMVVRWPGHRLSLDSWLARAAS